MAGQANVTINGNTWAVYIADQSWELSQGLSGVSSMPAKTGMFFDTGYQHLIGVQTLQMLFNLDIAFISEDFEVVEIHKNVAPGISFTSTELARYFLEVNAGELDTISVGDSVTVQVVSGPVTVVSPQVGMEDIWSMFEMMFPMVLLAAFSISISTSLAGETREYERYR
jgi:uncharacterized membrane protein (UPF0127 family)